LGIGFKISHTRSLPGDFWRAGDKTEDSLEMAEAKEETSGLPIDMQHL